jgi:hypothetical protein
MEVHRQLGRLMLLDQSTYVFLLVGDALRGLRDLPEHGFLFFSHNSEPQLASPGPQFNYLLTYDR